MLPQVRAVRHALSPEALVLSLQEGRGATLLPSLPARDSWCCVQNEVATPGGLWGGQSRACPVSVWEFWEEVSLPGWSSR